MEKEKNYTFKWNATQAGYVMGSLTTTLEKLTEINGEEQKKLIPEVRELVVKFLTIAIANKDVHEDTLVDFTLTSTQSGYAMGALMITIGKLHSLGGEERLVKAEALSKILKNLFSTIISPLGVRIITTIL